MGGPSELVRDFLAQRRIAVAGVSRDPRQVANVVFRKLRDSGYQVFPVNPGAKEVEGVTCHPDLRSIAAPIDGVMIVTRPEVALELVRECVALGISRVWMHRSFGTGSVSEPAIQLCRERGISAIAGGCPLMFCEPVDFGHRCIHWILGLRGRVPR
jgi:hypothetical protein